jgi:phenylacetate-CoA ligase
MSPEKNTTVPEKRRARNPLITVAGYKNLQRLHQHRFAPRWNFRLGDRVQQRDLEATERFRAALFAPRPAGNGSPGETILDWVARLRDQVALFRERLPIGFNLERDWAYIPTTSREDLVVNLAGLVPDSVDLKRLIVYTTSGTSGHSLEIPYHPRAVAYNHPLLEYALARYGIRPDFGPEITACINVCAQVHTFVFANVFSVWQQAAMAKVNLHPNAWSGGRDHARGFISDLQPQLITSDPISLLEMIDWEIPVRPAAILSTAVELEPALRARISKFFSCPVINWYSSLETGPIGFAGPDSENFEILAHDLHVEIVDTDGFPLPAGEVGEITVSGGRNPLLPLLRYRTGDFGSMDFDPSPRITQLQARGPVLFRATDGSLVNPVDVGRIIRECSVFVQHEFIQHQDGSCTVNFRPGPGAPVNLGQIKRELRTLFGSDREIEVRLDETLIGRSKAGKVLAHRSELLD